MIYHQKQNRAALFFALPVVGLLIFLAVPISSCGNCVFEITTETLGDGVIGTSYSQVLESDCEDSRWSLVGGSALPSGLTILSEGVITGTPNTAGSFQFVIKAVGTDSDQSILKEYTIIITDPNATGTAVERDF